MRPLLSNARFRGLLRQMKLEADQGGLARPKLQDKAVPIGCSPQLIALRLCCPVTCASEAARVALVGLSQCVSRLNVRARGKGPQHQDNSDRAHKAESNTTVWPAPATLVAEGQDPG